MSTLDAATLPVNEMLLLWLEDQRRAGRELHLFSAADERIVQLVAARFGIFESAHGSDGHVNLSGARKLAAVRELVGPRFTYAGDSRRDAPIWQACGSAVLVGDVARLRARLGPEVEVAREFDRPAPGFAVWRRALRLHQWAKNLLLFVAALLGGNILRDAPAACVGFVIFGLMASATYLINDMLDLAHDRLHRSKRHRPLASGVLPLRHGALAVLLLAASAVALLPLLPVAFAQVAVLYLLVTLAYSARIKRMLMLDVFTLAGLFTLRILAGIAAVSHPMSPWLLAFSMFFFLSLACIKRYGECLVLTAEGMRQLPGRAYRLGDAPWLMAMGAASAFSAVSTFFLFLVDPGSPIVTYPNPHWMWLICVILGYWICRTWALTVRGDMHDDPVLFAMKDRLSLLLVGVIAVLVLLARS